MKALHKLSISFSPAAPMRTYPILIGADLFTQVDLITAFTLDRYSQIAILTDENVASLWLSPLQQALKYPTHPIVIHAGEHAKTLESARIVWQRMQQVGLDRHALLINLGGGVIGDLGGFVASVYMRGIDFLQCPTTLLAQVDASVGGKVGINFESAKNLLGAFAQPQGVLIDIRTLDTLPIREISSGMAEVIKHGIIQDRAYFEQIASSSLEQLDDAAFIEMIAHSCALKAHIVAQDEREDGPRKLLNFGHTIGHAIESLALETDAPLLHGEAVSLGMLAEARISCLLGWLADDAVDQLEAVLSRFRLPIRSPLSFDASEIIHRCRSDKKNVSHQIHWTLLKQIGEAVFDIQLPDAIAIHAISRILKP